MSMTLKYTGKMARTNLSTVIIIVVVICGLVILYRHLNEEPKAITKCVHDIPFTVHDEEVSNDSEIYSNVSEETLESRQKDLLTEVTRRMIRKEMKDYNYDHSGVKTLEDLLLEKGGKPKRSIVISSWRSGSSFFGELLNAIPGNFYLYEPLMKYGAHTIRGPPDDNVSTSIIKNMLQCNFTGLKTFYFDYAKKIRDVVDMMKMNERLWNICLSSYDQDLFCYDPEFVSKLCTLFPLLTMKMVRYRLPVAKQILDDDRLDARIILLVRDPRAVLRSRESLPGCHNKDCSDAVTVCQDLVRDFDSAVELSGRYPDRFMAIRYEDLVLNQDITVDQILSLLQLSRTPSVNRFLLLHTSKNDTNPFSTYRLSRDMPFRWKTEMTFEKVELIQEQCQLAMLKWGYVLADNASHLASSEFYPLRDYYIPFK